MAARTIRAMTSTGVLWFVLIFFTVVFPGVAWADAQFYQGKTLTIVQGRDPGGTGDIRARAAAQFLSRNIPGHPTILMEYMPGGGSRSEERRVGKEGRSRW